MAPKEETGAERKRSLRTNWKGFRQGDQEHVGGDCVGGQAQGEGLHVGAGKERSLQERGLIEGANRGVAKNDVSIFGASGRLLFHVQGQPTKLRACGTQVFKFTILSRPCVMKALRGACAILFVFAYRGVHKETTIGTS
jgi:hypothetical protein